MCILFFSCVGSGKNQWLTTQNIESSTNGSFSSCQPLILFRTNTTQNRFTPGAIASITRLYSRHAKFQILLKLTLLNTPPPNSSILVFSVISMISWMHLQIAPFVHFLPRSAMGSRFRFTRSPNFKCTYYAKSNFNIKDSGHYW